MKPMYLLLTILVCVPYTASAQTPPAPPTPPAAPEPPAAPAAPVIAAPVIDMDALSFRLADLDRDADRMKRDALMNIDIEGVKAQTEQLKQKIQMQDFAFQMQSSNRGGDRETLQYNSGLDALQRRQYDDAVIRFDQVIGQKGAHADAALYWKAYSLYKLGRTDDAVAAIAELRKTYAQSRYLNDARVLEADARQSSGKPLTGDADNDEIKLLAIQGLQNSNPQGAVPLLENVLKATNSLAVKKRALFVLANNDQPAAHQLLVSYAKGAGNPDLQLEAIRYLSQRRQQTTGAELEEIYNSTQDVNVRRAVLDALVSARSRGGLIRIAGGDSPLELRQRVISRIGDSELITPAELMQLYQKEQNTQLRATIVRAMAAMGAADQITQVIKSEKDPAVRTARNEGSSQTLIDLYGSEQDRDTRKAIIAALESQGNAEGLVALARKESNSDLKLEIVRRLSDMAPKNKAAMDYLMELVK